MPNGIHYHDNDGRGIAALCVFLGVLIIIFLMIIAKLFILVGIIVILLGIIAIIYGLKNEEETSIIYGIIYIVIGILAIIFGNWLYGFLEQIGAVNFVKSIFGLFKS